MKCFFGFYYRWLGINLSNCKYESGKLYFCEALRFLVEAIENFTMWVKVKQIQHVSASCRFTSKF